VSGRILPRRLPVYLTGIGRRYPRTVLSIAVASWVVAAVLAFRVHVETDLLSLVPRDNPVVRAFQTTIERFGSADTLLVVVRLHGGDDLDDELVFAEHLADELRSWDAIDWVEYQLDDPVTAAVPLLDRATLFLRPDELRALLDRLATDEGVDRVAERLQAQLVAPHGVFAADLLRVDPVGLLTEILDRVRFGGLGVSVDPETGALVDRERRFLLMLAKPTRPAQDLKFDRMLVAGLDERVAEATRRWREDGYTDEPPGVDFTGGYVIALDDAELITGDVVVGLVSSLVGVMLLFLLAFRRRASLLYAFFPLVTGLGLTFAFTAVALGRLNSLTSAFGGLLVGLGIDFIIVLYGRYVEERQRGATHDEAIDALGRHTGVGVLLGAVTTAATFFAFLSTDFRGLTELGLITGTGILLLVTTVFTVLPALLTIFQHWASRTRTKRLYLHSFGSDVICRSALRHPWTTLVVATLVTVASVVAMRTLEFDDDIRNMRSADNRGVLVREEVMDAFGLRFLAMTVRVDGATESEALERARAVVADLEGLVDGESLASIDTVAGLIPAVDQQREVIRMLEARRAEVADLRARLEAGLIRHDLNPAGFAEGLDHFEAALAVDHPLRLADFEDTSLGRVIDRYVAHWDGGVSVAIYCYPPADLWRRQVPPRLREVVDRFPFAELSGPIPVSVELRRIVWGDAARAAVIGLILVFALMWADFGSPLRAMLALVPLLVGLVWMLGAMAWFGMRINFMNIFVLTMVIGIGVDYGVHLLHRWHESGGDHEAVAETSKAIAVAALTTVVGFGSLVLSHYPGLRSVGGAAILGALATAVLGITVLPVLLTLLERRRRDA